MAGNAWLAFGEKLVGKMQDVFRYSRKITTRCNWFYCCSFYIEIAIFLFVARVEILEKVIN